MLFLPNSCGRKKFRNSFLILKNNEWCWLWFLLFLVTFFKSLGVALAQQIRIWFLIILRRKEKTLLSERRRKLCHTWKSRNCAPHQSRQLWKFSSTATLREQLVDNWCGLLFKILYFDYRLPDKSILLLCYFYFQV